MNPARLSAWNTMYTLVLRLPVHTSMLTSMRFKVTIKLLAAQTVDGLDFVYYGGT